MIRRFLAVIIFSMLVLQGCSQDTQREFKKAINSAARDIDSKF